MLSKKHALGFIALVLSTISLLGPSILGQLEIYLVLLTTIIAVAGIIIVRNDVAGVIALLNISLLLVKMFFSSYINPIEFMVQLTVVGYGFSIANMLIGLSSRKDLDQLKAQISLARAHKIYGRAETALFFSLTIQCIMGPIVLLVSAELTGALPMVIEQPLFFSYPTVFFHTFIGGILPFCLFLVKVIPAFANKDLIYKHGMILGPIGFIAWSLAYFTSLVDFYFLVVSDPMISMAIFPNPPILPSMGWTIFISISLGIIMYYVARSYNARSSGNISPKTHGVALILHGVSFGYENAAKELVGAPVLYKYVYPYTYKSLDKLAIFLGLNIDDLKNMTVNDALETYMDKCAQIGMAEKIKIRWTSDASFTVESVNCSTAAVRSKIPKEEIKGSICPWALLAASLVNKLTGKDLDIAPSEFSEVGSKTEVKVKEKTQ